MISIGTKCHNNQLALPSITPIPKREQMTACVERCSVQRWPSGVEGAGSAADQYRCISHRAPLLRIGVIRGSVLLGQEHHHVGVAAILVRQYYLPIWNPPMSTAIPWQRFVMRFAQQTVESGCVGSLAKHWQSKALSLQKSINLQREQPSLLASTL